MALLTVKQKLKYILRMFQKQNFSLFRECWLSQKHF